MAHNSPEGNRRRQRAYTARKREAALADGTRQPLLVVDDDGRQCTRCLTYKPWKEFPDMRGGNHDKRPRCTPCHNEDEAKRMREARAASPLRVKRMRSDVVRLWRYGVTPEKYAEMYVKQDGRCAICGVHEDELPKQLGIDHCHETGLIRGLLCDPCNNGIGRFKDDPELLQKAAKYLEVCHQNGVG